MERLFTVEDGIEIEGQQFTTQYLNGSVDPSAVPGVSAPISSCFTRSILNPDNTTYTVLTYDKIGPEDTDWNLRLTDNVLGSTTDGTFLDGLFTFSPTTKTGDAVDQINEFLTLMAPAPAPSLSGLESVLVGATGKLSFDSTHTITGYSYDATAINTTVSKSGTCLGIFNGSTAISGTLNNSVAANSNNAWPAKSFGPGDQGTLTLKVNGIVVHTVDLSTFASGSSTSGGSGFTLSAATPVQFSNGNSFAALKYRTGTINIAAASQRSGYNTAVVEHNISGTINSTNSYYWYNSVDSTALTAAASTLTPTMGTTRYLSGVQYYNAGTLRLQSTVSAAYQDVYSSSSSAVSVTSSQASFSSSGLPNTSSNTQSLPVDVTASLLSTIRLLGTTAAATLGVAHPIKSALSTAGIATGKILYDPITTSAALVENFNAENYRVTTVPAHAATAPAAYDSTVSLSSRSDLQVYNGTLVYPKSDFRSVSDGGTIDVSPTGNPNYTGLSGNRTFIRVFQNNTGASKANFKINLAGASTSFSPVGSLSGNNVSVELKFPPGSLAAGTGWMDAYNDFATAQWGDGAGARSETLGAGRALGTDWGLTVGTQTIAAGEYVYVRITAPASWAGSIDSITFTWL